MSADRLGKALVVFFWLITVVLVVPAAAESKVRIVRLSEVQGSVQIDRAAGQGFEKAFLNLPVIEGARLRTGNDGRAEVEFEDGSALRIVPNSEVEFTRLGLGDDGAKLNAPELKSGVAYLNVHVKKGDEFSLRFGQQSVAVPEYAHFRVDLKAAQPTLSVFKGKVKGTGPAGEFEVAEKHSATFDPANRETVTVAKSYDQDPNDAWDRQQTDYHDRYANGSRDLSSPYGYGISDLNYYGSYINCPGYGFGWQPFLVNAAWNPFLDGAWVWYPGFGYTWVSGYPWGWMPFRYGNWAFGSGCGWFWQPSFLTTWYVIPRVVNPPVRTPPPKPPKPGPPIVVVGRGLAANPAKQSARMAVNPGSAGFGVPRGSVRHLDRVAKEVDKGTRPVMVTTNSRAPARTASTSSESSGSIRSGGRTGSSSGGSRDTGSSRISSTPHASSSASSHTSPHR